MAPRLLIKSWRIRLIFSVSAKSSESYFENSPAGGNSCKRPWTSSRGLLTCLEQREKRKSTAKFKYSQFTTCCLSRFEARGLQAFPLASEFSKSLSEDLADMLNIKCIHLKLSVSAKFCVVGGAIKRSITCRGVGHSASARYLLLILIVPAQWL